jgi:hypothetical protein
MYSFGRLLKFSQIQMEDNTYKPIKKKANGEREYSSHKSFVWNSGYARLGNI